MFWIPPMLTVFCSVYLSFFVNFHWILGAFANMSCNLFACFWCYLINFTLLPPVKFISLDFHMKTIFPNSCHSFFIQANTIESTNKLLSANFKVFVIVQCSCYDPPNCSLSFKLLKCFCCLVIFFHFSSSQVDVFFF